MHPHSSSSSSSVIASRLRSPSPLAWVANPAVHTCAVAEHRIFVPAEGLEVLTELGEDGKPRASFIELVQHAIQGSPNLRLSLGEIAEAITRQFSYFARGPLDQNNVLQRARLLRYVPSSSRELSYKC